MKIYRLPLVLLLVLSTVFSGKLFSQISVTPNLTALQLAEIFAGSNLTVSNAVLTGSPSAVASFTSSGGFDYSSGLMLCTGLATNSPGPNNDPNTGDNIGTAGNALLAALGGAASRDAVILEFDFVVQSASVQFNYIFASEEYPEFAPPNQPEFTDVFAFYISGPGITGEENIALVPGTSLAVNIQNINAVTNQAYYVDNVGGQEIQFDGYTTDLVATKSGLTPCQTYHLKLMISDIRTSVRNSAVFFQENSFVQESNLAVSTQTIQADTTSLEGCVQGSFTFKIPAPEATDRIISFTIGGTAVNGVDYQHIDNTLTIPAGDTMASIFINPFSDGITEGQETVVFDFSSGGCGGSGTSTMFIDDSDPINFTLNQNNLSCNANNTGEIIVNATGGFPPYNYTYTDEAGVSNVATVSPITGLAAGEYTVRVTDAYGCKAEALVIGGLFNAGTTFLPDGNGVTYEAPLTISGFGATDVILNVNQIQQVCMTLEHSYLGDLTIDLVSPSGEVIILKGFGGNSADLGEPVATGPFDDGLSSDPTPGNGYEYCFNANPTFGTMNGESSSFFRTDYTDNVGNVYSDNFLPAGSYAADGNFNSLLGASMNGDWLLRVTDNADLDNGYIFNWYISLIGDLPDSLVTLTEPSVISISGVSQNATCGVANGSINTTIVNAVAPYTVLWSNTEITEDIGNLNAAAYTITVTDANSCTNNASFNVSNTSSIGISETANAVSCVNGTDGTINVSVTGGQSPYTYLWSNSSPSEDLSGLIAGDYTLTVTDQQNCVKLMTFTVPNANPININLITSQNEICGTDNGSLNISANGGTGSFGYLWSNAAISEDLSALSAGTYTLTVTDGFNCTASQAFTIVNDISNCSSFCFLDAQLDQLTDENCGQQNGAINITVLNAVLPYSVLWDNGQSSEDLSNLQAGTYTLSIVDANNCSFQTTYTVANNTGNLSLSQVNVTDENCGNNQGAIDISISGGNLPYLFAWSNGATSEDLTLLNAGTYSITITEGNGCELNQSFTVADNPGNLNVSGVSNQSFCNSNNGSITQTVSGAQGLISYLWDSGATTQNRTNLAPGTYTCVIADALGCSVQNTYTVTESTGNILLLGTNATNETCANGLGAIDITASGTGLTFLWSNGAITEDISGLSAGTYSCMITNDQGCSLSTGNLSVANSTGGLSVSAQLIVAELCSGTNGSININVNSGTAPYTYNWSNGATTEDITSISAGIYTVNITDNVGCVKSQSFTVGANQGTLAISNAVVTNENCGNGSGSIDLSVSGGTMPLNYSWTNGALTEDLVNLSANNYSITVSDASGCAVSASYPVINQTSGLIVNEQLTNEICGNAAGAIDLSISGGTGPYTFVWSNASSTEDLSGLTSGTYTCIITDNTACSVSSGNLIIGNSANGMTTSTTVSDASCTTDGAVDLSVINGQIPLNYLWSNGAMSEDLSNVAAGTYSCVVTDANGCSQTASAVVIDNNNGLSYNNTFTDEYCSSGSGAINLSTSGGNGSLSYLWSNGATSEDLSGLSAGNYSCQITDQSGCSITTSSIQISNQSNTLQITALSAINEVCSNGQGSINLTVSGGTLPLVFTWSNGGNTEDLANLSSGVYQLTVTDQANCVVQAQKIIGNSAGTLAITLNSFLDEKCTNAGGSIQLTTNGGSLPYSYLWSNGATSEDLTNLSAGTYMLTVQDFAGCSLTNSFQIVNMGADLAFSSTTKTDENCGNNTGSIDLEITGGNAPYTYAWSNGATSQDLIGLSAGTYSVQVEDANGCSLNASYTILNQNGTLSVSGNTVDENCGNASGMIDVSVSGGNVPYSFLWSNSQTIEDLSALAAGTYNLTVTDNIGCAATFTATLANITNGLALSLSSKTDENCGLLDGAIDINTSGAGIITYLWSNGSMNEDLSGIAAGTYTLTATDDLGCSVSHTETIANQTGTLALSFTNIQNPFCGNADGFIDIEVSGTGPFTYLWSDGSSNQDLLAIGTGSYSVLITDGLGCSLTENFNVNSAGAPISTTALITDANCSSASGAIDLTVVTGIAPFSFAWSNGAGTEDLTGLAGGTYTVLVTDFYGCSSTASYTVGISNSTFDFAGVFVQDEFCGFGDGAIFVSTTSPASFFRIDGQIDFTGFFQNLGSGTYFIEAEDANGCVIDSNITVGNQGNFTISQLFSDETCGQGDGAIDITANDIFGQGLTFTYLWSNGASTEDLSNLNAGTYTVTVTDDFGCSLASTQTITNQTGGFGLSSILQESTCGTASGAIDITLSGGTLPYTILWSNGSGSEDLSALLPGTYSVLVSDATGCSFNQSFTINNSFQIAGIASNPSCGNTDGTIDLSITTGSAPYTFVWSNGASSEDLANLASGTYNVTVTDNLGCSNTASFTLVEQSTINLLSVQINPDFCSFGSGNIFVNATGVQNFYINGVQDFNFGFFSNLQAGTYVITLEDFVGCTMDTAIVVDAQGNFTITSVNTDENCGNGSGSIDITANDIFGQGLFFNYLWDDASLSEDRSGLSAGTYIVTVTDNFGCSISSTQTILNQTGGLGITNSIIQDANCGTTTGSIDITVTGGTGPYTFLWSNGAGSEDLSGLTPNSYSVLVTDAAFCSLSQTFTISNSYVISGTFVNPTCSQTDGSIDMNMTTGVAPYIYSWSDGSGLEDRSNLAAGSYTVTVTDNTGCSGTKTFTLVEQSAVQLFNIQANNDFCSSGGGSIFVNAFNVNAYYINGIPDPNFGFFNNLAAGSYLIGLEDISGCRLDTLVIVGNDGNFQLTSIVTDENCGQADGSINITANDIFGQGLVFSYLWNTGSTNEDISNLSAGLYTVTVTDNFGCAISASANVQNQTGTFAISSFTATDSDCGTATGGIDISVNGGTGPYTFLWSNGSGNEDLTGVSPGNYSLEITDALGCSLNQLFTVQNSFRISSVLTDASCTANDGAINITTDTGTAPFTFVWSNGASSEDLSNLSAGNYSLTVTDALGCSLTENYSILALPNITLFNVQKNPDFCSSNSGFIFINATGVVNYYIDGVPDFNFGFFQNLSAGTYTITLEDANGCTIDTNVTVGNQGNFTISGIVTDDNCGLGSGAIDITANDIFAQGLTFSYSWSNGSSSEDLTNLLSNNYTVTVTDNFGCSLSSAFTVNNLTGGLAISNANITQSHCGNPDGAIDITISGGLAPYVISWTNGASNEDISALVPGTYTVTITDAANCSLMQSYSITNDFQISGTTLNANCGSNNGSINLSVNSGVSPYTFSWSNGASSEDLSNLTAGNYSVTVTDATGCSTSASFTVNQILSFTLNQVIVQDDICNLNFGSIDIINSGFVSEYYIDGVANFGNSNFSNLAVGSYLITLEDFNGCSLDTLVTVAFQPSFTPTFVVTDDFCGTNTGAIDMSVSDDFGIGGTFTYTWSTGAATEDLTVLGAGVYNINILHEELSFGFSCQNSYNVTVNASAGFTATVAATNEKCNALDGAIDLTVDDGGAGLSFTYLWNTGATSEDLIAISGGNYSVTITDQNGCALNKSVTITNVNTLSYLGAVLSPENCALTDGSINISVSGANPISYSWSNGAATEDISGLNSGNYNVIITDANNCVLNESITLLENTGISISNLSIKGDTCLQGVGSILFTAVGTVSNYYIDGVIHIGSFFDKLSAGDHFIQIDNVTGCTFDTLINVPNVGTFTVASNTTDENCGNAAGAIDLTVTGGTAPYTFTWTHGPTTEDLTALSAGTYIVLVEDNAGCQLNVSSVIINNTGTLTIGSSTISDSYCNSATGSIDVTPAGGTAPYTYSWSNGASTQDLTGLLPGSYTLTLSDNNACSLDTTFTVNSINAINFISVVVTDEICGAGNGSIIITTQGAVTEYYLDGIAAAGPNFTNLGFGVYTIGISDGLGCNIDSLVTVSSGASFDVSAAIGNEGCGQDNGFVDLTIDSLGQQNLQLTYAWSTGATTQDVNNLTKGSYLVNITNIDGCVLTRVYSIDSLVAPFDAISIQTDTASCASCADGSIDLSIANSGAYSFLWSNGATSEDLSGIPAGTYTLTLTNIVGCDTTIQVVVQAKGSNAVLSISPNPATDVFEVEVNFPNNETGRLYMYDMLGQIVYESPEMKSGKVTFNANEYGAATYFFAVRSISIFEKLKFRIIN